MDSSEYAVTICTSCQTRIEFPLQLRGESAPCPSCEAQILLEHVAQESAPPKESPPSVITAPEQFPDSVSSPTFSSRQILDAVQGVVAPSRATFLYQCGMTITAFMMLLLPLVYMSLILLAGWGVYAWAKYAQAILFFRGGGLMGLMLKVVLYVGPLIGGIMMLVALIKPFFSTREERFQPLAMHPGAEPILYAFVAQICNAVGAPHPSRIFVNADLNASASFRRGLLSFADHDLVLTLGLPLVAQFSARQLAGIIAHEFGHFRQSFGMRLTYLICSINGWFSHVAHHRDGLDDWVEELTESEISGVALIGYCVQTIVGLARLTLKSFVFLGHLITCFAMRQMEYDADRSHYGLVGSEEFEATMKRIASLEPVMNLCYRQLRASFRIHRMLPDDLPSFIQAQEAGRSMEERVMLEDRAGLARTGFWDMHPSMGDRIRQARKAGEPGVFNMEGPGTALFSHFAVISKQVTQEYYFEVLEIPPQDVKLVNPAAAPVTLPDSD